MNSNEFYGQFDPPVDKVIKQYFPNITNGYCIEIGASDGVYFSNTLHFEKIGWKCLCIEPVPESFNILKNNRVSCLNYAISSSNAGNQSFSVFKIENTEQPYSAMSSLEVDHQLVDDLKQIYSFEKRDIKVSTRRLDWCISHFFNHKIINFITIDTEGNELDVLRSFNVNDYQIELLVIENNYNKLPIFIMKYSQYYKNAS